jgi:hypothetical protein
MTTQKSVASSYYYSLSVVQVVCRCRYFPTQGTTLGCTQGVGGQLGYVWALTAFEVLVTTGTDSHFKFQ